MNYEITILGRFALSTLIGFAIPFALTFLLQRQAPKREIGAILMSLAIVGACAGTAGGMSREAAVGSIVPAFLGLLGGLSIYLFGVDRSKGLIASFGAASMALSLIAAYTFGAKFRGTVEDHHEIRAICAKAYTDANLLGSKEAFEKFRAQLGRACDSSMGWYIETNEQTPGGNTANP